jgi:hypothetical protein
MAAGSADDCRAEDVLRRLSSTFKAAAARGARHLRERGPNPFAERVVFNGTRASRDIDDVIYRSQIDHQFDVRNLVAKYQTWYSDTHRLVLELEALTVSSACSHE